MTSRDCVQCVPHTGASMQSSSFKIQQSNKQLVIAVRIKQVWSSGDRREYFIRLAFVLKVNKSNASFLILGLFFIRNRFS